MAFLHVESGGLSGRRYEIGSEPLTIGRNEDNLIVLDDVAVSSHHCQVVREGSLCKIVDRDSTNGTTLNNHTVKESFLQEGDVISVGSVIITYRGEETQSAELSAVEEDKPQKVSSPLQNAGGSSAFLFKPRRRQNRAMLPLILLVVASVVMASAFFLHRLFSY